MKTKLLLFFGLFSILLQAQTTKTDAISLLLKLIPETGKPASWQTAIAATKGMAKWDKSSPTKQVIGYNIFGNAQINFNKQPIMCNGKACGASLTLNGATSKAYDEIEIMLSPDELPTLQLEKLIGKTGYTAKVLKKELDGVGGVMYYEVQFPGKPLVWIQTMTIPAYREEQSNDFSFTVFFNKKAMQSRMQ